MMNNPSFTTAFRRKLFFVAAMAAVAISAPLTSLATNDDARSFAIEAAIPWLDAKKNPYHLRETWWPQDSKVGEEMLIRHQLFARNDYRFWVACSDMRAKMSIQIYDEKGKLVGTEPLQQGHTASVRIVPQKSGAYFLRVVVESAPGKSAHWAVVYGYR